MVNTCDILLVEDDPHSAELILWLLKKVSTSYSCLVLKDGLDAIDFLYAKGQFSNRNIAINPRLILLDLKLTKIDGKQVLKEIKQNPSTSHIPTVVLTSSREYQDVQECYQLGANSYIVKPLDFQELERTITTLTTYWLSCNHPLR
jgi:two-component system response regulator